MNKNKVSKRRCVLCITNVVDSCFVGQCAPFRGHVCAGQGSWKQLPICCVSWQCAKSWTHFHTKKQLNWIELNYLLQDISMSSSSFLADGSVTTVVQLCWVRWQRHGNDNTRQVGCCRIKSLSILKTKSSNPYELSFVMMLGIIYPQLRFTFFGFRFIHPPNP